MNNGQPIPLMWYIFILLFFFRILALENIAKILTTGPRLAFILQPGVYNVHLPIMLESERQAVYRERKRKKVNIASSDRQRKREGERERERERDVCVCVLFEFRQFVFLLWKLVYVFQSFVSIFAKKKKSDRTRCLAVSILEYNLGPKITGSEVQY